MIRSEDGQARMSGEIKRDDVGSHLLHSLRKTPGLRQFPVKSFRLRILSFNQRDTADLPREKIPSLYILEWSVMVHDFGTEEKVLGQGHVTLYSTLCISILKHSYTRISIISFSSQILF